MSILQGGGADERMCMIG